MDGSSLIACHDCDLLVRLRPLPPRGEAHCPRCGAILQRYRRRVVERSLALTLTALVLFVLANSFPFLGMKSAGFLQEATLATGVHQLYVQGHPVIGTLVLLTTLVAPTLQILGLLYVLGPLYVGFRLPGMARVFRWVRVAQPWSMMEVFMLGILVSMVKLATTSQLIPGLALYSFGVLIYVLAALVFYLDPHDVWEQLGNED